MKPPLITLLLLLGGISSANAQYGCGTPYTSPCQVQIQPQQNLGQQMFNMANSFDPAGAFRQGQMQSQQYDLQQQQLNLQQQELELKRLELQKRRQQLQQ